MSKKWTLLLLAGILIFAVFGGVFAQEEEEPVAPIEYDYDELNVASATPMYGNFFHTIWGNNTSDIDVRMLLHSYDPVVWNNEEGMYMIDETVVSGIMVTENRAGDRTYTIALYDDLYYSDGSLITAWDYAFSTLLTMSPEAAATGAVVRRPEYLLGYEDYISGAVPYLAGFRVMRDDQLAITVKGDYLPFFYELGLLSTVPYPISVIAPGIRVADDGNGIYLTAEAGSNAVFSAEMLTETVLDPETGYLSHPSVTSGPYKLTAFEDGKAYFEINEYFKGNAYGELPTISRLTYETLSNEKIIPALVAGTVGLLNKITGVHTIDKGLEAVQENSGQLDFASYDRTGLGFISFNGERNVMQEQEVRQAIAYIVDKDKFVEKTVGEYGLRVDGYYGMGQWMYQILTGGIDFPVGDPSRIGEAEYKKQMEKWEDLSMDDIPVYEYDPEDAEELLSDAGWNLNADGNAYESGVRYKQTEAGLVPLHLDMAVPEDSSALQALYDLVDEFAYVGMELEITVIPFNVLLPEFYGMIDRNYDLYFLTSNFDIMFDPSGKFVMNEAGEPVWGETAIADQELYDLAVEMRRTEPGDLLTYCERWIRFQQRFEEVLPMLPIYSNIYYDFFPQVLHDYDPAANVTWSQAIVEAYLDGAVGK